MSIQSQFDQEALNYLPNIVKLINEAPSFESNQMECKTLQIIMNHHKPLCDMSELELHNMELALKTIFRHNEWII